MSIKLNLEKKGNLWVLTSNSDITCKACKKKCSGGDCFICVTHRVIFCSHCAKEYTCHRRRYLTEYRQMPDVIECGLDKVSQINVTK